MTTQLQRTTYDEALALVIMLGVPIKPEYVAKTPTLHAVFGSERETLSQFVLALPHWQRAELARVFDEVWPTLPRHSWSAPATRECWDFTVGDIGVSFLIVIDNWQKAWAYSIYRASQVQVKETACQTK